MSGRCSARWCWRIPPAPPTAIPGTKPCQASTLVVAAWMVRRSASSLSNGRRQRVRTTRPRAQKTPERVCWRREGRSCRRSVDARSLPWRMARATRSLAGRGVAISAQAIGARKSSCQWGRGARAKRARGVENVRSCPCRIRGLHLDRQAVCPPTDRLSLPLGLGMEGSRAHRGAIFQPARQEGHGCPDPTGQTATAQGESRIGHVVVTDGVSLLQTTNMYRTLQTNRTHF